MKKSIVILTLICGISLNAMEGTSKQSLQPIIHQVLINNSHLKDKSNFQHPNPIELTNSQFQQTTDYMANIRKKETLTNQDLKNSLLAHLLRQTVWHKMSQTPEISKVEHKELQQKLKSFYGDTTPCDQLNNIDVLFYALSLKQDDMAEKLRSLAMEFNTSLLTLAWHKHEKRKNCVTLQAKKHKYEKKLTLVENQIKNNKNQIESLNYQQGFSIVLAAICQTEINTIEEHQNFIQAFTKAQSQKLTGEELTEKFLSNS